MTKYIQLEIRDQVFTVDFDAMMKDKEIPADHKEKIRHQVEDLGRNYLIILDPKEIN